MMRGTSSGVPVNSPLGFRSFRARNLTHAGLRATIDSHPMSPSIPGTRATMNPVRTSLLATTHVTFSRVCLLLSLAVLVLAGCSDQPGAKPSEYRIAAGPRTSDPDRRSLSTPLTFAEAPEPQFYEAAGWNVQGVVFRAELTSDPVRLDASATLSFMPFALSRREGPIELRLDAVTRQGTRTIYRSRFENPRMGPLEEEGIVNLDLSSMAGETIALRWRLDTQRPKDSSVEIVIGFARISHTGPGRALPNIIVICSDTHRADYSVGEHMPHLTRFAADSVIFDQAIANASWTIPSVVSFLTGLEPYRHGTGWRVEPNQEITNPSMKQSDGRESTSLTDKDNYNVVLFNDQLTTLQEVLEDRGYFASAWIENRWVEYSGILADGFSQFVTQGPLKPLADRDAAGPGGLMLEEHVQAFLRTRPPGAPFFLYLHSKHVHDYVAEPENVAANGGDLARAVGDPANRIKTLTPEAYTALYVKRVREFDEQLGALFEVLREEGVYEDSMVLFYSDHGEQLMDCGDTVGHGNALTETLLHVPLIVKMPASIGVAPARIEDTVQLIDVFPTVLDLLDRYGAPNVVQGRNGRTLLPRMMNGPPLDPVLIQSGIQFFGDESVAVRDATVKLISNLTTGETHVVEWRGAKGCEPLEDTPRGSVSIQALTERLNADVEYLLNVTLRGDRRSLEELSAEQRRELEALGYLD